MPSFIKIVKAVQKSTSISRVLLNFRRLPILRTALYRNFKQASNFGSAFDQLFLRIFFMKFSQKMSLYLFYTMVQKGRKYPKTKMKGGPALRQFLANFSVSHELLGLFFAVSETNSFRQGKVVISKSASLFF